MTSADHEPGCVWRAQVSDSAGGGELVVMVLGPAVHPDPRVPPSAAPRYLCLTLLNTTQLSAASVEPGGTRDWPLAAAPWERIA